MLDIMRNTVFFFCALIFTPLLTFGQQTDQGNTPQVFSINGTTVVVVKQFNNETISEQIINSILNSSQLSVVFLSSDVLQQHLLPCRPQPGTATTRDVTESTGTTATLDHTEGPVITTISDHTENTRTTETLDHTQSTSVTVTADQTENSSTPAVSQHHKILATTDRTEILTGVTDENLTTAGDHSSSTEVSHSSVTNSTANHSTTTISNILTTEASGKEPVITISSNLDTTTGSSTEKLNATTIVEYSTIEIETTESVTTDHVTESTSIPLLELLEGKEDSETLEAIKHWRNKNLRLSDLLYRSEHTPLTQFIRELATLGDSINSSPEGMPLLNLLSAGRPNGSGNPNEQLPISYLPIIQRGKQKMRQTLKILIEAASYALEHVDEFEREEISVDDQSSTTVDSFETTTAINDFTSDASHTRSSQNSDEQEMNMTEAATYTTTASTLRSSIDENTSKSSSFPSHSIDSSDNSVTVTTSTSRSYNVSDHTPEQTTSTDTTVTGGTTEIDGSNVTEPEDCVFWVQSGYCQCPPEGCSNWSEYVRRFCKSHCEKDAEDGSSTVPIELRLKCDLSEEALDVRCPPIPSYIPHPEHCECFYQCKSGQKHLQVCPSGLHFDQRYSTNNCIQPQNAGCPGNTPQ